MRAGRGSRTAVWVSAWRGLGGFQRPLVSHDPVAKRLVPVPYRWLLEAAERAPQLTGAALALADTASLGLTFHLPFRTRAIDEAIDQEVTRSVAPATQLVLLGAGLDARAYRLPSLAETTVFEIDHPATQAEKRLRTERLEPLARRVVHVAVDFTRHALGERLADAGHDRARPSVVVWEGVTMYLERPAIETTLRALREACAPGSCLLVTYYDAHRSPMRELAHPLFRLVGEPLVTRFSPVAIGALLAEHGFAVESDEGDEEWSARFLGRRAKLPMTERLVRARRA
jgi:methyltransferase (TIGR00027 family)